MGGGSDTKLHVGGREGGGGQNMNFTIYSSYSSELLHFCIIFSIHNTVLAGDPCTCLLDRYKIKRTGKNCPNYTIREEMHGQLCKNQGKNTGSCLMLAKTLIHNTWNCLLNSHSNNKYTINCVFYSNFFIFKITHNWLRSSQFLTLHSGSWHRIIFQSR